MHPFYKILVSLVINSSVFYLLTIGIKKTVEDNSPMKIDLFSIKVYMSYLIVALDIGKADKEFGTLSLQNGVIGDGKSE